MRHAVRRMSSLLPLLMKLQHLLAVRSWPEARAASLRDRAGFALSVTRERASPTGASVSLTGRVLPGTVLVRHIERAGVGTLSYVRGRSASILAACTCPSSWAGCVPMRFARARATAGSLIASYISGMPPTLCATARPSCSCPAPTAP